MISFGMATWRVLKKTRTLDRQSGGIDEAQGPLGVIIRLKGNRNGCRVVTTENMLTPCTPPGTAGTVIVGLDSREPGEGATAEAARLTWERALGK